MPTLLSFLTRMSILTILLCVDVLTKVHSLYKCVQHKSRRIGCLGIQKYLDGDVLMYPPLTNHSFELEGVNSFSFPFVRESGSISFRHSKDVLKNRNRLLFLALSVISAVSTATAPAVEADDDTMLEVQPAAIRPRELKTDEFQVVFTSDSIGLGLKEVKYKDDIRVAVQSIKSGKEAAAISSLRTGLILVSAGDLSMEGLRLSEVGSAIGSLPRPLKVVFRDPQLFFRQLNSSSSFTDAPLDVVSTSLRPRTQRNEEQVLKVERIQLPPLDRRLMAAEIGDVVEVRYQARYGANGRVFSGVENMSNPTAYQDNTFFVLGKQPETFPDGFDLPIRGMSVGELRRIHFPALLAFGAKTAPSYEGNSNDSKDEKGRLPEIVYDILLVSLNGSTYP